MNQQQATVPQSAESARAGRARAQLKPSNLPRSLGGSGGGWPFGAGVNDAPERRQQGSVADGWQAGMPSPFSISMASCEIDAGSVTSRRARMGGNASQPRATSAGQSGAGLAGRGSRRAKDPTRQRCRSFNTDVPKIKKKTGKFKSC